MIQKPYILAIDPGLLTGICLIKREPMELMWSAETDWWDTARHADHALRTCGGENVDVVLERFIITQQTAKNSQQQWSIELIGIVRFLSRVHGAGDITLQTPADAKNFATNARLKQLDLWHVGGEGHALDALRHGLLRLVKTGWKDSRLVLS